jgi:hypothetical protein
MKKNDETIIKPLSVDELKKLFRHIDNVQRQLGLEPPKEVTWIEPDLLGETEHWTFYYE